MADTKTDEKKKGDAPVAQRPFFTGSLQLETRSPTYSNAFAANAQPIPTFAPKTNGFLADLWIRLVASGGAGAGTLQAVNDGIFGYISSITISDTNGQPMIGPVTGHEMAMLVKWGGFVFSGDPRTSEVFSEVTTSGNGFFTLHLPIQWIRTKALGVLPNTNSNQAYAVDVIQASNSAVFSTPPPTTLPTVAITFYQDSYRQSSGKDAQNNPAVETPPSLGSTLYVRRTIIQGVNPGQQELIISQSEGGYRAMHFIFKDSVGSRVQGDADWPNPVQVFWNNDIPIDRTKDQWIRKLEMDFGYTRVLTASANPVGGRDQGVYTLPFIQDGGQLQAGNEDRYQYWWLSAGDTVGMRGNVTGTGAHSLTTIHQYVKPAGGLIKNITAR
jgi:hypothetical protein